MTNVQIIARRGVVQSAFALKEVRELNKLQIKLYAIKEELEAGLNDASYYECTALGVILPLFRIISRM